MPLKQSIYLKKVQVRDSLKFFMGNKEINRIGAGCNEFFKFVEQIN